MNAAAQQLRARLEGALIPAVPVPFDAAGNYQPDAETKLIRYHAASPSAGVAVWVHTGRGLLLPAETRRAVFTSWRRGLSPNQFIIAGVGCSRADSPKEIDELTDDEYIARAVALAEEAKALGADGFLVYAPTKFRGRADQDRKILEHHEAIASVGVPLVLFYLYEAAGGISYSLDLLDRLLALPQVAGIKVATLDSVMTFQSIAQRIKSRAPKAALITGEDRFFGYTLMRGSVGALIGMGCCLPGPQAELIAAWREGRLDRFAQLSTAIDLFAETTFVPPMEGYIRRMMIALAHDGVLPMEATFDPWGPPIGEDEIAPIGEAVRRLRET